jgi:DNA invertase Pin-like site-specific DNA recombinase
MQAIVYVRQSLDQTGEGLGVQRQEEECRRLCETRGWTVKAVLRDNSVSATTGNRPAYQQLLAAMQRRECDVVVTYRLDRLLRRMTELEQLIELVEDVGVDVATVQGDIDLTNSSGRLMGRILASVARAEVETKSERHKLANAQKARAGKPHGSRRPYGYEPDLMTVRESEAAVLREMARLVLSGHGFKDVAYWANENGHTTSTGRLWYPITVRNMLQKPRYGGIREYNGSRYAAQWEPVFDPATWERLQLAISARQSTKSIARKYLLTGLVYCGKCGQQLNGATKRDHPGRPLRRTYHCRVQGDTKREGGCGGVVRNADALEHFIRECIVYRLDTPALADLLGRDNDGQLREHLEQLRLARERVNALVDDYASGLLNRQQFSRAKTLAEAEVESLAELVNRTQSTTVAVEPGQTVRDAWMQNGDDWRRSLMSLFIKRIVLKPGNTKPFYNVDGKTMRFDPDLVVIDWLA